MQHATPHDSTSVCACPTQRPALAIGDLVFTRVGAKPFREIASATGSWTNHVGVLIAVNGAEPLVAESRFPWSGVTTLSRFVARSQGKRYTIGRLRSALSPDQQEQVVRAARQRYGIFYDTGFDLHSRRQFCSRYVREVLRDATGIEVGAVETLAGLLARQPQANTGFWRLWYLGQIPWQRETVTPASQLHCPNLHTIYDSALAALPPADTAASTQQGA